MSHPIRRRPDLCARLRLVRRRPLLNSVIEAVERRLMLSTYFVSTAGTDANVGTLAQPFRTIQHAAAVAEPGDTVLIRGGVYRETVTPAHSGTPAQPITFAAYHGENVVVSGADPIAGWSNYRGSIYSAPMSWTLGGGNDQVFVDGRMMTEARWPNTSLDPSHPTLAHVQAAWGQPGQATIYDPNLTQPDGYWNGASIHIFAGEQWVAQTAEVASYHRGYLTFYYHDMGNMQRPQAGDAYYLFGKFQALDSPGEWYRDPSTGKLYLWTPDGSAPAIGAVEAKHRQYAFDVRGLSDIHLDGINFVAATIATDAQSARLLIDHLNAAYTSQFTYQVSGWDQPVDAGISLMGPGSLLENSTIAYSAGDGVYVGGGLSRVTNTVIHDVDYNGGDSAGIRVMAPFVQIDHDTIYNTARNGIAHFGAGDHIVYNTIHDVMQQTTDGGATYTVRTDGAGTEIAYNTIYNVRTAGFGGVGIYLDNDSSDYVVDHNTIWNVDDAMKLNFTSYNEKVTDNVFDATSASVASNYLNDWSGSVFTGNVFFRPVQMGSHVAWANNRFSTDTAGSGIPSSAPTPAPVPTPAPTPSPAPTPAPPPPVPVPVAHSPGNGPVNAPAPKPPQAPSPAPPPKPVPPAKKVAPPPKANPAPKPLVPTAVKSPAAVAPSIELAAVQPAAPLAFYPPLVRPLPPQVSAAWVAHGARHHHPAAHPGAARHHHPVKHNLPAPIRHRPPAS